MKAANTLRDYVLLLGVPETEPAECMFLVACILAATTCQHWRARAVSNLKRNFGQ